MNYTLLGESGLRVSEAALGTMTFGDEWGWDHRRTKRRKIFFPRLLKRPKKSRAKNCPADEGSNVLRERTEHDHDHDLNTDTHDLLNRLSSATARGPYLMRNQS